MQTSKKIIVVAALSLMLVHCSKKEASESSVVESLIAARKGTLQGVLTWRGIVRSANRVEIRANKKIKIGKVAVKNFDTVKKGQLLIEVDNTEAIAKRRELGDRNASLKIDRATVQIKLRHSAKNLARKTELGAGGIVAQKEVEEAKRDYKIALNDLKTKELETEKLMKETLEIDHQLKSANFFAPLAGVVSGIPNIEQGGREINQGQSVATVFDPSVFALWVQVEETNLQHIVLGREIKIELDAVPGQNLTGKITEINPNATDANARVKTYNTGISFDSRKIELKEGFSGAASLVFSKREQAISVPMAALRYVEGKSFLMVARDLAGSRKLTEVTLGLKTETEAEVLSGISETDSVIISKP